MQKVLEEITQSPQELLEWSQAHPGSTLRQLEEKAQTWKVKTVAKVLEAAVALQGEGTLEARCSCGGEWVFQGDRERQGMTAQGVIRVKRAYFTCDRCRAGISPLERQLERKGGWSEGAVAQILWTAQAVSSYREAAEAVKRWAGIAVSKSTIQRLAAEGGNAWVQRQQEAAEEWWGSGMPGQETPPPREEQKEALGISRDGVIVWVEDGWHEVKVGRCFEFVPGEDGEVEVFRRAMGWYAYHHGLGLEGKGVVIGDGAAWLDDFMETDCPGGVRIVDGYQALEPLGALGQEA